MKLLADMRLPLDAAVHLCAVAEVAASVPPNAGWSREARAAALGTIAEVERAEAERVLAEGCMLLATKGYTVTTSLRTGHAAGELLTSIREFSPDLVIIGAKGRTSAKRFLLGSVAQKVVKYTPSSVLVVRR